MPKISIILPCYNTEKYLVQCMESVINQTLKDIEIICVDDGSKDSTGEILDNYAKNDSRIKVIHKENSGYGASMNVGLDNATGDYIGIVEPDDFVELDMFETLYNKAVETNVDFVKSDFFQFSEDMVQQVVLLDVDKTHYDRVINPVEDKTMFHIGMNTWTGIYKKDFIRNNNIRYNETPGARYQDQGFWFQTMMNAKSVYIINKPFYHYRYFQTNSSNNPNGFSWIQKEYEYIYNLLKQKPEIYNELIIEYNCFKFIHYLFNYMKLDKKSKKRNLKFFRETFLVIKKNNEFDENLLNIYEHKMYKLLIKNANKFYRRTTNSLSLPEKIFSVKNEARHKFLRILGFKFKIRNKFNVLRTMILEQNENLNNLLNNKQDQIDYLNQKVCEQQLQLDRLSHINTIQSFGFYNGDDFVKSFSLGESFIKQINNNDFYKLCNKYFAFRDLKEFHPHEVLIYIASCLNTNRIEKAQNLLNEYVNIFGLDEIWRFLPVAKFAKEQGITDENIEKAAFVFNKLEENRKNKLFEKLVEGKTVAVVGNGPSEIGKGKGAEIDSHDIVIRMNNYQTEGFEQDYGAKTDIWIRGFGGQDLKDYTLDHKYILAGITGDYEHIPLFWEFQLERLYRELNSGILTTYISPEHYRKLLYDFDGDPTTGLSLMYTLLNILQCEKIDFYGYACFEDNFEGYATHYFNDRSENEARQRSANHSFNNEAEYMRKLIRG